MWWGSRKDDNNSSNNDQKQQQQDTGQLSNSNRKTKSKSRLNRKGTSSTNNNNNSNSNNVNNNAMTRRRRRGGGVSVANNNSNFNSSNNNNNNASNNTSTNNNKSTSANINNVINNSTTNNVNNKSKSEATTTMEKESSVLMAEETGSGIEVSFSGEKNNSRAAAASDNNNNISNKDDIASQLDAPSSSSSGGVVVVPNPAVPPTSALAPPSAAAVVAAPAAFVSGCVLGAGVISLNEQLAERQKIYKAQFNLSSSGRSASRGGNEHTGAFASSLSGPAVHHEITSSTAKSLPPPDFQPRKHRISLFGSEISKPQMLFEDILFLLRTHEVADEVTSVRDELAQMDAEIEAMEEDRRELVRKNLSFAENDKGSRYPEWDIYRQLASPNLHLSGGQRRNLQEQRGMCLTISLQNKKAQENLLSKCGNKPSSLRQQLKKTNNRTVTVRPEAYRDGGAGASLQHISLLRGATESSFLLSKDSGKTYYWGRLPDRLFRRMKASGVDPQKYSSEILYLATGPLGSYYAEFRSGECWWGSPIQDDEFQLICREWDIHRVAFGSCVPLDDGRGRRHVTTSWIVLGRDGRVAWKNLPTRLHNKLESRMANQPAPIEVALGYGDSYFVRFVDGSTDYSLPATTADALKGLAVTSLSLHPELPHDFIIRHR